LEVVDLIAPERLEYGQVFVNILSSGICGRQLQEVRGECGNAKWLPHCLGHEAAGIVCDVGPGVTRVKVGDKTVMHWRKAAGLEGSPVKYQRFSADKFWTSVGAGPIHTFQHSAIISENRLTPVPPDTSNDLCALLGCGLSTALATIEREAKLKWGESILIVGCGGLGTNLILAAKMMHARVFATDIHECRNAAAMSLGVHGAALFPSGLEKGRFSYPNGFDVIVNTAGTVESLEETLPFLAASGRYIVIGHQPPGVAWSIKNADHMFGGEGKSIKWTQGGGFRPDLDIQRFCALHRQGALNIDGIISRRLGLDQINEGLDLVRSGLASRVLIDMSL
jgi:S-(hydroxymethyl)glutathione dehydrogenase/alcohol dehydrogenase